MAVALPAALSVLLIGLAAAVPGVWMWRHVRRAMPDAGDRRALALILVLAAGLLVWGLDWGVYGDQWAPDELRPDLARDALRHGYAGGWHDKYPVLHYAVLGLVAGPFELAARAGALPVETTASYAAQLALMRFVSVLLGLGTLVAACLCGGELRGPRAGVTSALLLSLTPLFVYYGKVANLDVPALCWTGWTLLAFIRILRGGTRGDYVLLGVAAAAAVATKDQSYASLALLPPMVLVATARGQAGAGWIAGLGRACLDSRLLAGTGATLLAFVVFHNLFLNPRGVVAHFTLLATLGDIGVVPRTAAGYAELTWRTVDLFRLSLGWPAFVLALAGVAGAARRPDRRWWLWLLLVPLAFHLTFTWVTMYVSDRYLFGGVFVLVLFAGAAVADIVEPASLRAWRVTAVAAIASYTLLYGASINVMMNLDARHVARQWLRTHAGPAVAVGLVGGYQPELRAFAKTVGVSTTGDLEAHRPDWLLVNDRFAYRYRQSRRPESRTLMSGLADGSLGYREVFRHRGQVPFWAVLQYDPVFRRREESLWTNLDKINPEMVIYRRR